MPRPPVLTSGLNSYLCHWPEPGPIEMRFERLEHGKRGRVSAEVTVSGSNGNTDLKGQHILLYLGDATFDLSSAAGRETLWKKAGRKADKIPTLVGLNWEEYVDQACHLVREQARRPEEAEEFTTDDEIALPPYVLAPLLRQGQPTILFGDGGVGKGLVACYCYCCLTLGWVSNPLELGVGQAHKVLYLDWEADRDTTAYRLKAILSGSHSAFSAADPPQMPIIYRRCRGPLAEDLEAVDNMIRQKKTEALIIDSLGLAAGTTSGDPSGPALSFMDTLRKLGKAAFVLGHIPKGLLGEENKSRRVYGSVFFTNLARNVFELRSTRLPDLHEISAALFHRKTNDAWLAQKPLGLRIKFADMVEGSARRIVFEPDKNFRDKPQLAQGLPLKERLRLLLQHFQPLTPSSLSKEAHVSTTAIRDMLNNEKEAFIVVGQLGKEHLWGLRSSEEGLPSDEEA